MLEDLPNIERLLEEITHLKNGCDLLDELWFANGPYAREWRLTDEQHIKISTASSTSAIRSRSWSSR